MILTAVAAAMLATGAQAETADDMTAEARVIRAVLEMRELWIKQDLERRWASHNADTAKVQISGNNITVFMPQQLFVKMAGADLAKQIGIQALRVGWGTPLHQYFHVVLQDADGVTIEAVVNRADYPTAEDLYRAERDVEKQEDADIYRYLEKYGLPEKPRH